MNSARWCCPPAARNIGTAAPRTIPPSGPTADATTSSIPAAPIRCPTWRRERRSPWTIRAAPSPIGLAWADALSGPWHRSDAPLLPVRPGTFRSFLTSNAAPHFHEDGRVVMLFKARAWQGQAHGPMSIGVATAPAPEGPYAVAGAPLFPPARWGELEDPFLWHEEGRYKMIAKDMTGRGCGQAGGGIYAVSRDALHWERGVPPTAYRREVPRDDGTMRPLGNIERPFLLRDGGAITHLCAAVSDGREGFGDATRTWNMVIPVTTDDSF